MTILNITARRWSGGWELWDGDYVCTQVRTLAKARHQMLDYLDTIEPHIDHSTYTINITPEIPSNANVQDAIEASQNAESAQRAAYQASRHTVRALKADGFSLADIGFIMGLSRARISQLANS